MKKAQFEALPEKDRLNCTLEGIAFYASVHTPNMSSVKKFNGDPYFIVNLGLQDEKEIARAKSFGLEVFEPEGQITLPYVKLKRKVNIAKGKTAEDVKPDVVDTAQNTVPSSILIGNGSKVRCKFATYWAGTGSNEGVKTALMKVQILDLVPFKAQDRSFVSDGSGFTIGSATKEDATTSSGDDFADELPWDEPKSSTPVVKATGTRGKSKAVPSDLFD